MLPTDNKERKQIPIYSGLLKYFPDALAAVAHHSYKSNEQHNPGTETHWDRSKSSDHLNSFARHLVDIEEDTENVIACAWRVLAYLQERIEDERKSRSELS